MARSGKSEEYLFVEEDLAALRAKVADLERAYQDALSGVHESTTQSSETWHDNPAFDDVQQRSKMYYTEYSKLNAVLSVAKLTPTSDLGTDVVSIGSRVQVILNEKTEDEFVVCSYRCFQSRAEAVRKCPHRDRKLRRTRPGSLR